VRRSAAQFVDEPSGVSGKYVSGGSFGQNAIGERRPAFEIVISDIGTHTKDQGGSRDRRPVLAPAAQPVGIAGAQPMPVDYDQPWRTLRIERPFRKVIRAIDSDDSQNRG
jgi:hypothetical protein